MSARIVINGDHGRKPGRARGAQAVFRILEGQALRGRQAEPFQNMKINIGRRFLRRHHVARPDHLEPGPGIGREGMAQQRADIVRRRGGGDRQTHARATRLPDQTSHPRSQRNGATLQHGGVMSLLRGE